MKPCGPKDPEFACSVTEDDVQVNGPRDPVWPHPGPRPPGEKDPDTSGDDPLKPPEGDPY